MNGKGIKQRLTPFSSSSSFSYASPNAFRELDRVVPEGQGENSPAFQRWVGEGKVGESRRDERNLALKMGFRPSLRDLSAFPPKPSVETLGYCRKSLRDKRAPEFPKGIRSSVPSKQ